MKIARWAVDGMVREGFVIGSTAVPFPSEESVSGALAGGLGYTRDLYEGVKNADGRRLEDVALLAPLEPSSIRDFVAFEEHVEGVSAAVTGVGNVPPEWYEAPTFYFTNPHTVIADGEVLRPPQTERLDFELEVAAVIGSSASDGCHLTTDEAEASIFGYTIMNDWSARDLQAREMKVLLGPAKGKDFATTLGPWIVTADELAAFVDPDGYLAVEAAVYVNGQLIGADLLSNMGWRFRDLVAYASRNSRVVPGDVLGSGTVGNGGCLGELWGRGSALVPGPLQQGDEVRMTVQGIGAISNVVGRALPVLPIPAASSRPRVRHRAT